MARYAPTNRIIAGAVAPVVIFYSLSKLEMPLEGAILASVWGLAVLAWFSLRQGEFDGFSAIGAAYAISELAGVLVMRDPNWYLISPTVSDGIMGAVFLASMATRRPLIQVLAEQTAGPEAFPDEVRESVYYRKLWLRLSLLWGGVNILRGVLNWVLLTTLPMEAYLASRVALGWPVTIGLIALSFWYPKRYWQRVM